MFGLILIVIIGVIFGYFATQNTGIVLLKLTDYTQFNVPLYFVILGSLLIGLIIAWVMSFFGGIFTFFKIRSKDSAIHAHEKRESELETRINELEAQNEELKNKKYEEPSA